MSYIKLDKKITDWGWFTDGNVLKVWIYLLVNAQYKPTTFKGIELDRGQIVVGRKKLAEKLGMTEQSIRTCLNRLKSTNEITIKSTNKYSVITIVKYAFYQDGDDDDNQQINQVLNQQVTNKQPTTNHSKRSKEVKKEKNSVYIGRSERFIKAFKDFEEMRSKKKKPMTDRAKELIIKDLENLTKDEDRQIAILEKSTKEGWSGVYALKDDPVTERRKSYEEEANEWKNF